MQFAKMGLVLQQNDWPLKRRATENDFDEIEYIEPYLSDVHSSPLDKEDVLIQTKMNDNTIYRLRYMHNKGLVFPIVYSAW